MSPAPDRPHHEWRIDDAGLFSVLLDAHGDEPAWLGAFGGGAGCNPADITAADVALVAWYATVPVRFGEPAEFSFSDSFAAIRALARQAWAEACELHDEHARRAADPHEPEPSPPPWWAPREE